MEVVLKRIYRCPEYTIGNIYVDNKYIADTLEDTDRDLVQTMPESVIKKLKVYGKTAIHSRTKTLCVSEEKNISGDVF